jgi:UDP-N-acetylglucosamine 2-epimerase (non-hydrolysing)
MPVKMKVLTVIGTRPEAIKLAPVIRELDSRAKYSDIESIVCSTAQHREMLDQVFEVFRIRPDYDLQVMERDQTLIQTTASVLSRLEPVLHEVKPDWVLVQGDTTTVMAAAIAAFYTGCKVGHVEAGLRSFDRSQPFPEEINRRLAGVIADLHFAPTDSAQANLIREGISSDHIMVTGNTVVDALQWAVERPDQPGLGAILSRLNPLDEVHDLSDDLEGHKKKLILVTAHRRENFGKPIKDICLALKDIAESHGDSVHVVYPVHRNPNILKPVHEILGETENVTLMDPVDYLMMVQLMKSAYIILTDSGGIQEEAPTLSKPVLVLRSVTERPEAIESGTAITVGTDRQRIVSEVDRLLEDESAYRGMAQAASPFGDGKAAARIVALLLGENIEPFNPDAMTGQNP